MALTIAPDQNRQPADQPARTFGQATGSPSQSQPQSRERSFGDERLQRKLTADGHSAASLLRLEDDQHHAATYAQQGLFSVSDRQLLCAMAAMQIRYGSYHEAVALLMRVNQETPSDPQCARLLATALLKLGRAEEAATVFSRADSLGSTLTEKLLLVVITMRLRGLSEARRLFSSFMNRIGGRNA